LADRVALNILKSRWPEFVRYSFLERGSDERQYCSPGVDLPVVSVMRSKYGTYPGYHTSLDDLNFVSPAGLRGSFEVLRDCLRLLERNKVYRATCIGEPFLSARNLYPTLSTRGLRADVKTMMDVLAYADGTNDLVSISDIIGVPAEDLYPAIETLQRAGLISEVATAVGS
jgi:aminopeptidase-like protein